MTKVNREDIALDWIREGIADPKDPWRQLLSQLICTSEEEFEAPENDDEEGSMSAGGSSYQEVDEDDEV
jgi:hypothetical protein